MESFQFVSVSYMDSWKEFRPGQLDLIDPVYNGDARFWSTCMGVSDRKARLWPFIPALRECSLPQHRSADRLLENQIFFRFYPCYLAWARSHTGSTAMFHIRIRTRVQRESCFCWHFLFDKAQILFCVASDKLSVLLWLKQKMYLLWFVQIREQWNQKDVVLWQCCFLSLQKECHLLHFGILVWKIWETSSVSGEKMFRDSLFATQTQRLKCRRDDSSAKFKHRSCGWGQKITERTQPRSTLGVLRFCATFSSHRKALIFLPNVPTSCTECAQHAWGCFPPISENNFPGCRNLVCNFLTAFSQLMKYWCKFQEEWGSFELHCVSCRELKWETDN